MMHLRETFEDLLEDYKETPWKAFEPFADMAELSGRNLSDDTKDVLKILRDERWNNKAVAKLLAKNDAVETAIFKSYANNIVELTEAVLRKEEEQEL